MDLSETYRSIARRYFPRTTIVADRFHVIRLVNQHILKAWQDIHPEGRRNRGLLSLMRWHKWKLSTEQHYKVNHDLQTHPALHMLYHAKQRLCQLLVRKNQRRREARQSLNQLQHLLDDLRATPLRTLARTLTSWL